MSIRVRRTGCVPGSVSPSAGSVAFSSGRGYLVSMYLTRYTPSYVPPDILGRYVLPEEGAVMSGLFLLFDSPRPETGSLVTCAPHGDCLVVIGEYDDTGTGDHEIRGRFLWRCPRTYLPAVLRHH